MKKYEETIISSMKLDMNGPVDVVIPRNATHYIVEGGQEKVLTLYDSNLRGDLYEVPPQMRGGTWTFNAKDWTEVDGYK